MFIEHLAVLSKLLLRDGVCSDTDHRERRRQRKERREKMALEEDDPDAVVNLGQDDATWFGEAEGSAADSSSDIDSETEGSLQPYDMSDDESELEKRKLPSQLRECAANLRKADDPDAVRALEYTSDLCKSGDLETSVLMPSDLLVNSLYMKISHNYLSPS